jgi:hypothetical protein
VETSRTCLGTLVWTLSALSKIRTLADVASSACSTPKCILFAKLPEPYGSECGGMGSECGFEKIQSKWIIKKWSGGGKEKNKIKGKGKARVNLVDNKSNESDWDDEEDKEERGWWVRLLLGSSSMQSLSLG